MKKALKARGGQRRLHLCEVDNRRLRATGQAWLATFTIDGVGSVYVARYKRPHVRQKEAWTMKAIIGSKNIH